MMICGLVLSKLFAEAVVSCLTCFVFGSVVCFCILNGYIELSMFYFDVYHRGVKMHNYNVNMLVVR